MSDKRIKLSGSGYRKLASEKKEKQTSLLKTYKKVDSFFKPLVKPSENGEGCSSSWQQHNESDRGPDPDSENSYQETSVNEPDNLKLSSDNELNNVGTVVQVSDNSDITVSQQSEQILTISDDPIEWKINDAATIDILLKRGINQNKDCDFQNSKRELGNKLRYFNKTFFNRKLLNRETILCVFKKCRFGFLRFLQIIWSSTDMFQISQ